MRELFAVVPLVAGFAGIQLLVHLFQFENNGSKANFKLFNAFKNLGDLLATLTREPNT